MRGVQYALLRAIAVLVACLPHRALGLLGGALGVLAGSVVRIRWRHVVAAMQQAGVPDAPSAARAMYRGLGTSVFELLWLSGRAPTAAVDVSTIDAASQRALDGARAGGRGVVLAASHTGNWDLAACAVAAQLPLLVVTKRLSVEALDRFWQRARARSGVTLAHAQGALTGARAMLRSGGAVAMMIDQVPDAERHATRVPFLGGTAWVDRAPATLAAQTGAPMVVCAARRGHDGRHVLEVLTVLTPPSRTALPTASRAAWVVEATREATFALDRFILENPSEWLWMHRRWKAPPARLRAREREEDARARILSPRAPLAMPAPCTPTTPVTTPSSSQVAPSEVASS